MIALPLHHSTDWTSLGSILANDLIKPAPISPDDRSRPGLKLLFDSGVDVA